MLGAHAALTLLVVLGSCTSASSLASRDDPKGRPASLEPPDDASRFGSLAYQVVQSSNATKSPWGKATTARAGFAVEVWNEAGLVASSDDGLHFVIINPRRRPNDELLARMRPGAVWLIWVPKQTTPPLDFPSKPPTGPLLYRLELKDFDPGPEPPLGSASPPDANREPNGLVWVRRVAGYGKTRPTGDQRISIQIDIWDQQLQLLETTKWRRSGMTTAAQQKPVLSAALVTMVEGEKRRLWVPAALSPDGFDEIVDLSLLSVEPATTEFVLDSGKGYRRVLVKGHRNYMFRKSTNVKEVPPRSPSASPPVGWVPAKEIEESSP